MQIEIKMIPTNEIIPYWRNPRRNDKTVDALVDEIQKMGFNVPIVVDKNNVVVKGHARLKAAKRLGMEEIPCVVSNASDDVIRADRIADNKIQELSGWDFAKLETELDGLKDKMSFKKLFFKEDFKEKQHEDFQSVDFAPVQLDWGEDKETTEEEPKSQQKANFDISEVFPIGQSVGHQPIEHEMPKKTETTGTEKKQLKTLCPYCGKVVIISV